MSDLIPPTENGLVDRLTNRSVDRFTTQVDLAAHRKLAVIQAESDLQVTRAQAVNYVGTKAMQSIALLSQMEQQLGELVPIAVSRLQAIGDITALSTAEVVANTVSRVTR